MVFFLDHIIYEVLNLIKHHCQVDFRQKGRQVTSLQMSSISLSDIGVGSSKLLGGGHYWKLKSGPRSGCFSRLFYIHTYIICDRTSNSLCSPGHHSIDLTIHGQGVMGHLLRSILRGFNSQHTIDNFTSNLGESEFTLYNVQRTSTRCTLHARSNRNMAVLLTELFCIHLECLPSASKTPTSFLIKVSVAVVATWLLVFFEAYSLRSRRAVGAFFYRKVHLSTLSIGKTAVLAIQASFRVMTPV